MKNILLFFSLFLFSVAIHAQSLMGLYTSSYSSYKEKLHPEESYEYDKRYEILLGIIDDDNGTVAVKDFDAPDEIKYYKIESFGGTEEINQKQMVLYNASIINVPEPEEVLLSIYFEEGTMNLLIIHRDTGQIYYDLKPFSDE